MGTADDSGTTTSESDDDPEFGRFKELTRRLLTVPKRELDESVEKHRANGNGNGNGNGHKP